MRSCPHDDVIRGVPVFRFLPLLVLLLLTACITIPPGPGAPAAAAEACGPPQITVTTPNSIAVARSLSDDNNAMLVAFRTGDVTWWTAMVSQSVTSVTLGASRGNGVVTFQEGLTLSLIAQGPDGFNLFLSGKITDSDTLYNVTGAYLGNFRC